MKLRRLKSQPGDKIGQKFADFRIQLNLLTDEVERLREENEKLCLFESLIEGTTEGDEFYLLELIDKLRKNKRDKKSTLSIE